MKNKLEWIVVLIILTGICSNSVLAEENWITEAKIDVQEPGIVEALLPPGLHFRPEHKGKGQGLDLVLRGSDGNKRPFELYWKDKKGPASFVLKPESIKFYEGQGFIWEGFSPEKFIVSRIRVDIADGNYIGKVDVEGLGDSGWQWLEKDAAVFKAGGHTQADIKIRVSEYKRFRLHFSGYDKKYEKTPLIVKKVEVFGEKIARDYIEKSYILNVESIEQEDGLEISAVLPGSGLWIQKLEVVSDAQFQGKWKLGRETVLSGKRTFKLMRNGSVSIINSSKQTLTINVNQVWKGRSLILKLDSGGLYVGKIQTLSIVCRLPRMVFLADKIGLFTARTGMGVNKFIRNIPGDLKRRVDQTLEFSIIRRNVDWHPEDMVVKFGIKGGPFSDKGYTWKAGINIPDPGYYMFVLNEEACLDRNPSGIRLVQNRTQIPYFWGKSERKEINPGKTESYDREKNLSNWVFTLPRASKDWYSMRFTANGIFERKVVFEKRKPGNMGWQYWKNLNWKNRKKGKSILNLNLSDFPDDQTEIRMTMNHGDNSPLEIFDCKAVYKARTMFFLAVASGNYELYGGNSRVLPATYDLSLVYVHLMENEPGQVFMEHVETYKSSAWKNRLRIVFSGQGWGLYAVLGIVTLILLIIIIRLFPKSESH